MISYRFFLKKNEKLPDMVIIPIVQKKPRREANYLERLLFYTEAARGKSKLIVPSKRTITMVGGLDKSIGFGEDRLLEKKLFRLFEVDTKVKKNFEI